MSSDMLNKAKESVFVGYSAHEIVTKKPDDWKNLTKKYTNSSNETFCPHEDGRLADCYNFLYTKQGEVARGLDAVKTATDKSILSAGRLVLSSWLNAFLFAHEGKVDYQVKEALIEAMKEKGDGVLHASDDVLSIPNLKEEYFDPKVQVDSVVAISLGSTQMVEIMRGEGGPFRNNPDLYKKMSEGALIRQETAIVVEK